MIRSSAGKRSVPGTQKPTSKRTLARYNTESRRFNSAVLSRIILVDGRQYTLYRASSETFYWYIYQCLEQFYPDPKAKEDVFCDMFDLDYNEMEHRIAAMNGLSDLNQARRQQGLPFVELFVSDEG